MSKLARILALLALMVAPSSAYSQEATPKRALPDYDGRDDPPTDVGDVALWVPRVLVSPLYLTSEYVVRRPMGALVVAAEKGDWPAAIMDFFTFGEERKVGLVPTAFVDFGFKPSVGLYFFADDILADGNDIRANVGFWGTDWLKLSLRDRVWLSGDSAVEVGGSWLRRPDYLFHGFGPETQQDQASRYGADMAEGHLRYDIALGRMSSFGAEAGVRDTVFREGSCCDDPSIQARAAAGELAVPGGFDDGYTAGYARIEAAVDTREAPPESGGGLRAEGMIEQDVEVNPDRPPNRWVKYGGSLGGFVDLTGHRRVLSVWVTSMFADPHGGVEQLPFNEAVLLGGSGPMRGYREGRLTGRSALVATMQYEWPIWVWMAGTLQVASGNVFGAQLEDFEAELLRLSTAIGLRSIGSSDHYLEILTGVGTETYEEGWDVSSFRLVVGGNSGF